MKDVIVKIECCGKEMVKRGVGFLHSNVESEIVYICGECGLHKRIETYSLDDEELLDELESFSLEKLPIYQEVSNGDE